MGCGCNKKKETNELVSRAQDRQNRKESLSKILDNVKKPQDTSRLPLISAGKKPVLKPKK